jgi:hypothetical protein
MSQVDVASRATRAFGPEGLIPLIMVAGIGGVSQAHRACRQRHEQDALAKDQTAGYPSARNVGAPLGGRLTLLNCGHHVSPSCTGTQSLSELQSNSAEASERAAVDGPRFAAEPGLRRQGSAQMRLQRSVRELRVRHRPQLPR